MSLRDKGKISLFAVSREDKAGKLYYLGVREVGWEEAEEGRP